MPSPERWGREQGGASLGGDEISVRNSPDPGAAPTATRPIPPHAGTARPTPISDRNLDAAGAAPNGYDGTADLIELGELATVRLVRAADGRASREALVRALRADLATLEGR